MKAKLLVILSLALVRAIFAGRYHEEDCSRGDAKIVQTEWNTMWFKSGTRFKIQLAKRIIFLVVETHPESIELFRGVGIDDPNSGEFEAHCLRIINQMDHMVNLLTNKEALRKASEHLGNQHAVRAEVLGRYFETFIAVAMNNLVRNVDNFHHFSWNSCMKLIFQGVFDALP